MYKKGDYVRVTKDDYSLEANVYLREYPKGSILKVYEDAEEGELLINVGEPDAIDGYVCLFTDNVEPYRLLDGSKIRIGNKVRVRYREDDEDDRVHVDNEYTVTGISKWGNIEVSLGDDRTYYLLPSQVEAVPYAGEDCVEEPKVDENAGLENVESPVMIDVDKVIGVINRGELEVSEIIAYLEGYREGVRGG